MAYTARDLAQMLMVRDAVPNLRGLCPQNEIDAALADLNRKIDEARRELGI